MYYENYLSFESGIDKGNGTKKIRQVPCVFSTINTFYSNTQNH